MTNPIPDFAAAHPVLYCLALLLVLAGMALVIEMDNRKAREP